MLLAGGIEPGKVEEVFGAGEAGAVGEEEEARRDERRRVLAVGRGDIVDALPAGRHGQDADIVRVPVESDHGFRWKLITQSGGR